MRFWIILLSSVFVFGQEATPPLDIPLKLSGTFGEFRPTHFHAGIDIKTQGKEGFKVKAIQSGSVRRIKIATSGYGKCLYIEHENGTTSVYAHLKKFAPKIEAFIKAQQYAEEQFLIQRFLPRGEMAVEQGEVIGYSGNTGGSMGPHLHFEIRETKAEKPLNPLTLNFDIPDSIRPIVQGFYQYPIQRWGSGTKKEISLRRKNDSTYMANIQNIGGKTGFGIRLFDRQDQSYNRNGVYSVELYVNGTKRFGYTFDRIDFSDGKKIDALIDYATYREERRRIQKLFNDYGVDYSFIPNELPDGNIDFEEGKSYQVKVILKDYAQNKTQIIFYVEGIAAPFAEENKVAENMISPDKDYLYLYDHHEVYIPKNCFYRPVSLPIIAQKDTLKIEAEQYPQRKGFELKFGFSPALDSLSRQQLCLAKYTPKAKKAKNRLSYVWATKKDSTLHTRSAYPGTYVLAKDSLPPTIKPLNFRNEQWVSNYKYLEFELEDDFSGVQSYRGTINGKWILLEHEPKDKRLTYDFNDIDFDDAALNIVLEATDGVGNKQEFSAIVYRKPKR